jgi:uncharacterized protein (UPF0332 family)
MSLSDELVRHAIRLLDKPTLTQDPAKNADFRRAVSASYYALFHRLSEAVVLQIAPQAAPATANRVHRWLDHQDMKKICWEFAAVPLRSPLRELIGNSAPDEIQTVALNFIKLQEARHAADYDLQYQVTWRQAREYIELAVAAIGAWTKVEPSPASNVFVLSLLLWKNWDKDRRWPAG